MGDTSLTWSSAEPNLVMAVRLNNSMVDELKKSFRFRDYDNDGQIFTRDIGPVVRSVKGLKPSEAEIVAMINEVDRNGGMCNLETLVQMISREVTQPEPDSAKTLAEMFKLYDRDGRGLVSVGDLRHVLTNVGEKLTEQEADDLLKLSGSVERGMVNYHKFVEVIMAT